MRKKKHIPPPPPPKKEYDWEKFKKLCFVHATLEDICAEFQTDRQTFQQHVQEKFFMNFSDVWFMYAANGRNSTRSQIFKLAMEGHWPALQALSKQFLGYRDIVEVKSEHTEKQVIEVNIGWRDENKLEHEVKDATTEAPALIAQEI